MDNRLTHFSLFTGIGGIDLASEWAGFETVGQCEFADYPFKILKKHWPDVPKWRDIKNVTIKSFRERTGMRTVNLVSGGFPCQPFSVAGKQKGKNDKRYLWPEMLRVIKELAPRWIIGENVPGILRIAGETVCEDLEREGYNVTVFNYEAAAVGAPHRRERVFFVGERNMENVCHIRCCKSGILQEQPGRTEFIRTSESFYDRSSSEMSTNVADTYNTRLQVAGYEPEIKTLFAENGIEYSGCNVPNSDNGNRSMWRDGEFSTTSQAERAGNNHGGRTPEYVAREWRNLKSGLGGMVNGIPDRLDNIIKFPQEPNIPRLATGVKNRKERLICLGNAVVPQQIYPIIKAIADIENGNEIVR